MTVLIIPAAPGSVTAPSAVGATAPFTVSWSASGLATSYTLRKTRLDTGAVTTVYSGSGTSTSTTLGGLTEYEVKFAVQACHGSQCSGWTNAPHDTEMIPKNQPKTIAPASGQHPMRFAAPAWAFFTLGLMAAPAFAADAVYYYSSDTLHSEVVVTDASRNVVERTYYSPYGQVLNRDLRDGPGYTGHEEDPETNLVYMQQRYYDPEAGRFLSTDPVQADGNGGSFNRYEYADDNPYRYTDPFGMCTGSHISDSHGNCASTGGDTTGTNGATQGMMREQAERTAASNAAAQRASAMMRSPSSHPTMLASNSDAQIKRQEKILYYKTLAQEIQVAALHGKIPTDWVESGVNIGKLSGDILLDNMAAGRSSFNMYVTLDYSPNPVFAEVRWPINWSKVDWAKFARTDESYEDALKDFGKYANSQSGH